jgi:ribosomal protein S18 acetylase RimI-like enzyme
VARLETHRSQRRFVATVAESLADALVPEVIDGAPVVPWFRAIAADGELAGFVMIAETTEQHPEPYLWRLLIDRRHQRRGIGERALVLLAEHLRAAGDEVLLTSWVDGPGGPEPFYRRLGFEPTGTVIDGEIEGRVPLAVLLDRR